MIYARLLPLSFISLVVSFQAQELRYFYLLSQWYYVSHPRGPSLQQGQCIMKRQTWTLSEQLGAGSPPALGCKEPLALWSWKWRSLNRQNLCQCGSLLLLRLFTFSCTHTWVTRATNTLGLWEVIWQSGGIVWSFLPRHRWYLCHDGYAERSISLGPGQSTWRLGRHIFFLVWG